MRTARTSTQEAGNLTHERLGAVLSGGMMQSTMEKSEPLQTTGGPKPAKGHKMPTNILLFEKTEVTGSSRPERH